MIKNEKVDSFKPKLEAINTFTPKNQLVFTSQPKLQTASSPTTNRLYEVTLGAGMLVGFGPAITYPQSIMIVSPKQT